MKLPLVNYVMIYQNSLLVTKSKCLSASYKATRLVSKTSKASLSLAAVVVFPQHLQFVKWAVASVLKELSQFILQQLLLCKSCAEVKWEETKSLISVNCLANLLESKKFSSRQIYLEKGVHSNPFFVACMRNISYNEKDEK